MTIKLDNLTQEQIEAIKKQIAKFEEENQKPEDSMDFYNGWVIHYGKICETQLIDWDDTQQLYSIGLYRDTKEEAEKLLRKMQIEHRLRQWAKMCEDKMDWENESQCKYFICRGKHCSRSVIGMRYTYHHNNNVYFTDESILQRAIKDIGEQNLLDNYFVEV